MHNNLALAGRQGHTIQDDRWDALTSAQKTVLFGLYNYGYKLLLVNHRQGEPYAVVANGFELGTLDPSGKMSFNSTELLSSNC
ncbi:hypothetical protein [Shewanella sedimentimangrovi]|uniref:Uncharacterized protein n=1 Tax=Shewanella sedimentimangrovi TaxID=2814293 RepID=A0ABX7R3G8_9GAMM|nr:hypothetical protein [Shewanella sedimentimangrovi]QSX37735.1 hypothetical protein JYB85_02510 [Shewanella sedimentimangrovi]